MNKLVVDNHKIYQQGGTIFLSLRADTKLEFYEKNIEVYMMIEADLTLDIICTTKAKLHILNRNHQLEVHAHLSEAGDLSGYVSILASNEIKNDIHIFHGMAQTNSKIICHGLSYGNGQIHLSVNGIIPRGHTGCICQQENHIINLNHGCSSIEPNLFIDEYDVIANHAAYIGDYPKDQVFYLQTKGLSVEQIYELLSKAFLKQNSTNDTYNEKIITYVEQVFIEEVM